MASVASDPNGRRRVLFIDADKKRRTIRLGKIDLKGAECIRRHVEDLQAAKLGAQPIPARTAAWLTEIGATLRAKLAAVGLAAPREPVKVLTVGALVAEYTTVRADVKPGTTINYNQAGKKLVEFFGAEKSVADVTEADAEGFYRDLLARVAFNTARRLTGRAKQFFAYAVRKRIITTNPFSGVKTKTGGNAKRQQYVPAETIRAVLEACPSIEWRLIVALCRYAGLRCPSEHLALTWGDILWDKNRFVVRSPKTEGYEGKEQRVVPIFPELYPYLRDAFEAAEPGQVHVITRNRRDGKTPNGTTVNWRTQFLRIIEKAGLKPWPRLFHQLRAACQTDLNDKFPTQVGCEWLGNSIPVAEEHYLQTTEEHYQRAAQNPAHSVAQNAAQTGADGKGPERTKPGEVLGIQASRPILSAPVSHCPEVQVTLWGFEPQFLP